MKGITADCSCHKADQHRPQRTHKTSGRGDRHKTSNRPGGHTHRRGLAPLEGFDHHPAHRSGSTGRIGGEAGQGGQVASDQGTAAIEAKPAKPKQASTHQDEWHVVGR